MNHSKIHLETLSTYHLLFPPGIARMVEMLRFMLTFFSSKIDRISRFFLFNPPLLKSALSLFDSPSKLILQPLLPPSSFTIDMSRIDRLIFIEIVTHGIHPKFSANCSLIYETSIIIGKNMASFDLNPNTPGNGYRSLLRIIELYSVCVQKDLIRNKFASISQHLVENGEIFAQTLGHLRKSNVLEQNSLIWPPNHEFIELGLSFEPLVHSFYSKNHSFWLAPSLRTILGHYISLTAYRSLSLAGWTKGLRVTKYSKTFANFAMNSSVEFLAALWGLSENFIYKRLIPFIIAGGKLNRRETFSIPRQDRAWIDGNGVLMVDEPDSDSISRPAGKSATVRVRLLQRTVKPESQIDTLLFHVHGAGFIAQSPESHEIYLREWALRLEGMPILSVDYCLSPKHKFPEALMDCLDAYLWVISGTEEVKQRIGFHPKNIVLCGDSAGGGLILSLSLVLNDLIRFRKCSEIRMPMAVIPFYPVCSLQSSVSPSRLFTCFETFLPLGCLLSILDAYFIPHDAEINLSTSPEVIAWENRIINSACPGPHTVNPPWYRRRGIFPRLEIINQLASSPYASPILYEHFDSLVDLPLYIIVGEFDPLLDENIELAKRWKGPVKLDILKDLAHGFLYFNSSHDCREAKNQCFKRILESMAIGSPKM
ncbi:hormone-sensitive lipase-like [Brevipalpus obovatus]|uniref:hormone-sensitive lipase-like n=1 Tax=Brevipalpus obovatus TaxID=246614 RepID=UPI003D9EF913